ncbi:hypothetical protein SAMN04487910_0771 [Aquimarina amphilecti]|uniref:Outer membrane protein beta-barrel domain-containing protein n=1 Tax=Aquimarina amphilecti TaxID=1038014 RepID=A0A1H7HV29_AQUAM|nr:hypothetical protein [Aquimarina amphilecti]SEK54156.1 hypothetical protein SAMN04487910_0771 [Aquimarina amphilecti]
MKQILIIATILFSFQISFAQDQTDLPKRDIKKNEISINPFNIVVFGALDLGYERILSSNNTLGFDLFYRLTDDDDNDDDNDDDFIDTDDVFDKEIAFTTRFKYFFGDRIARGFYIEAFGMLSFGEHEEYVEVFDNQGNFISSNYVDQEYTDFALGFAVGGKFVTRNGFFIDIGFGIGRNLFSDKSPEIIVRPNLYLGYRF